jgi:hypothetical protein
MVKILLAPHALSNQPNLDQLPIMAAKRKK